jgi:L-alanine-DL-glutamate epimerase-like enolase superfamily enzyme
MNTSDLVAGLPLLVEDVTLEGLELAVSPEFLRRTTVIRVSGGGEEGIGEDVIYDADEQERFRTAGPPAGLAGEHTLASFSALLADVQELRRWGFEAAALDLALRQAGLALHEVLGREPRPVRFVVSTALGPDRTGRLRRLREIHPDLRFKLDPASDWDEALVHELAELDCVDVVDFKESYTWREASRAAGPALYRAIVDALPNALIEDPGLSDPEKAAILEPHRERITWDAPIHSVADVDALPFPPRALNSKPSRFGSLGALLDFYDLCAGRGISLYGGGQFELGPGRGQIQYLASLVHPDAPNDVAPAGYNRPDWTADLPGSPLPPAPEKDGFRWLHG